MIAGELSRFNETRTKQKTSQERPRDAKRKMPSSRVPKPVSESGLMRPLILMYSRWISDAATMRIITVNPESNRTVDLVILPGRDDAGLLGALAGAEDDSLLAVSDRVRTIVQGVSG